jgi:predicted enzyme related to lactoylglutathione lyase
MSKTTTRTKEKTPASIVWFNVPADDIKRAQKFYKGLFGWKIAPFRGMNDFLHIDTGGEDASPDGGIGQRQGQDHAIVNYISVDSVDKYITKIQKLGGRVCMPKTAVPQMGYFAVCQDTENNGFGLWQTDSDAK